MTLAFFGIREIKVVLRLFSNFPWMWNSLKTSMISSLMTSQQVCKKAMEKPSGPYHHSGFSPPPKPFLKSSFQPRNLLSTNGIKERPSNFGRELNCYE